ncbi:unnamed protein product [Caretta caretta]
MLVVVKKGYHAAQYRDLSGVRDGPYLPIYSHTRFCNASLCNHRYWDNCHIPAFPTDNTSASLWCYACIGTTPESCSLRQAQQSRFYDDSPRCFDGTGMATIGGDLQSPSISAPARLRVDHAGGPLAEHPA